jgi:hypothetical protein
LSGIRISGKHRSYANSLRLSTILQTMSLRALEQLVCICGVIAMCILLYVMLCVTENLVLKITGNVKKRGAANGTGGGEAMS